MLRNKCWFAIVIFTMCCSCDSNYVFDEYKSVPSQWHKDSVVTFNIVPPDSINTYNLFVNLRNTSDYKYSNLFLIVEMNYPHGKTIKDTLEYDMAEPSGKFLGTGFTDIKENKLWYKGYNTPFNFEENGDYEIKIQHAMRKNGEAKGVENLEGITDIGFRIEHTGTN